MKLKIEGLTKEVGEEIMKITNKPIASYPKESVVDIIDGTDKDIEKLTDAKISSKRVNSKE